jgi:hypothetical protein
MTSLMYAIHPRDPAIFLAVAILVAVISMLAAYHSSPQSCRDPAIGSPSRRLEIMALAHSNVLILA